MLSSAIIRIVDFCARYPRRVFVLGILLAAVAVTYDVARFSITTDTENLIANDLPWRHRQADFANAFPQKDILVVVTAPTPENSEQAANALETELARHTDLFRSVVQPDGGKFFQQNGLLFEPLSDVKGSMAGLSGADFLVGTLAADPTLRGAMKALSFAADGVHGGEIKLDQLVWPLSLTEKTLSDVLAGKPATFSWQSLVQGAPPQTAQLRHFIEVQPVLDYSALQPGRKATDGIHRAAADLQLAEKFGAAVQLTGAVPMNDDQFAVIRQSALRDTLVALFGTLIILWLALRSWKIVAAVAFSVVVGLATTAALGLALVGAFNLLSIAFFVLFVGLGVDFGIQFSVRYRSERHDCDDLHEALRRAAREVAAPLTLAAAATAVAFFSFLPTPYRGLSELGLIAGSGMLVAFLCSITLVPAVLALLSPPGEASPVGFSKLASLDDLLQRHRIVVIAGTFLVVIAGAPLLFHLPFDFNPINLQDPKAASVMTYRELQGNPLTSGSEAEVVTKSLADADSTAKRLAALPQVLRVLTLNSFVPDDQDQKIAIIKAAATRLHGALEPKREPAPSDKDTVDAIRSTAENLSKVAGSATGPGAEAARKVSSLLIRLAQSDAASAEASRSRRGSFVELRSGAAAEQPGPAACDHQEPAEGSCSRLAPARRKGAGSGLAEGRPKQRKRAPRLRDIGHGHRALGDRSRDKPVRVGQDGHRCLCRSGHFSTCRHRDTALDRLAAGHRRVADADTAAAGWRCHPGNLCIDGHGAQLRQHHRPAAAARRRRCVQDLLHPGMARRKNRIAAIQPDPGRDLQRHDQCGRFWQHVVIELSRHVKHGKDDGARAALHDGSRRAVSAGPDGATAPGESGVRTGG